MLSGPRAFGDLVDLIASSGVKEFSLIFAGGWMCLSSIQRIIELFVQRRN